MKILITGGCGYIGIELTKKLLKNKKNKITVLDIQWFGNKLRKNKNLKIFKFDIRNIENFSGKFDLIIHLANIANDPTAELNPNLSWDVNVLASMKICEFAIRNKINKIIFLSSGSVYGIKKEKRVTENLSLKPISVYNKTKMIAERIFLSYKNKLNIICLRPATVCGASDRIRLDLTINKLAYDAMTKGKIFVDGGSQIRPNVYIQDIIDVIFFFIKKKKIRHNIYNVGFENHSVLNLAKMISKVTNAKIIVNKNIDPRSYRQDSTRLIKTGFKPKYSVMTAIEDLKVFFKKGKKFSTNNFNIQKMKKLRLK
jgi:nucleoside-diphosphate-sugar epimerase